MADTSNMSRLRTAPAGKLPAMQASGDSRVPGADLGAVPQLDPRLLEVCSLLSACLQGMSMSAGSVFTSMTLNGTV